MEAVPQDHHYLPQVYLRQWCQSDRLWRYRYVGKPPRLEKKRKAPASIAYEPDLYRIPEGSTANHHIGNALEQELGWKVDQRIPNIVTQAARITGRTRDHLERDIVQLMKTFVARSPQMLAKQEEAVAASLKRDEKLVEQIIARALTPEMKALARQFKNPHMPKVAARAALAASIEGDILRDEGWLEGDVHVVHARDVEQALKRIGAGEFVTFENPVIEWSNSESGLVATFSLSPELLVLVVKREVMVTPVMQDVIAAEHNLTPVSSRRNLLCRTEASGTLAVTARLLMHS